MEIQGELLSPMCKVLGWRRKGDVKSNWEGGVQNGSFWEARGCSDVLASACFFPEPDFRDNRQPEAGGGVWRSDHFA